MLKYFLFNLQLSDSYTYSLNFFLMSAFLVHQQYLFLYIVLLSLLIAFLLYSVTKICDYYQRNQNNVTVKTSLLCPIFIET